MGDIRFVLLFCDLNMYILIATIVGIIYDIVAIQSSSSSSPPTMRLYGSVSYFELCGRGICAAIIAFLSAKVKGKPRTRHVMICDAKISNIEI